MVGPNALVAAAQVLTGDRTQDPSQQKRPWQEEAWAFYDQTGPLRYATNWLSNLISKATLQAATMKPGVDEPTPVDSGDAADAVASLAGGYNGQKQMLKSCAVDLTVPGLCYLVGEGGDVQTWRVYSADVLRMKSPATPTMDAVYQLQDERGQWRDLDPESVVVKIWRPHERFYWEPDSPARAALGDLRELRRIRQYIDAQLVSRLSGAGILILPQEVSYPTAQAPGGVGNEPDAARHPFITEIMEVMMTAIREPGTAAAVVPIPIEIPAEYADAIRHITFSTELSDKILEMRESALRQCAITLDVPAEVLTGMGDLNHWGAWQIEESAVKIHAEPLLELICSALTNGFLHPVLKAQGMPEEEAESWVVWADTSELATKPDKSDDTTAAYDRGEASGAALRRETGLSEADRPNPQELEEWAYKQMVRQPANAATGAEGLGIKLPEPPAPVVVPPNGNGQSPNPDTPGEDTIPATEGDAAPTSGAPPSNQTDARVLVLESYVHRALERAGNRIRSKHSTECTDVPPHVCVGGVSDTSGLLAGAWDRLTPVLCELEMDAATTIERLNAYCRTLLERGLEYDRASLATFIKAAA